MAKVKKHIIPEFMDLYHEIPVFRAFGLPSGVAVEVFDSLDERELVDIVKMLIDAKGLESLLMAIEQNDMPGIGNYLSDNVSYTNFLPIAVDHRNQIIV